MTTPGSSLTGFLLPLQDAGRRKSPELKNDGEIL